MHVDRASFLQRPGISATERVFRFTSEDEAALRTQPPSSIQDWALSKVEYHKEYTRQLASAFNANARIHRSLPPEILAEIFSKLNPQHRSGIRFLHVCRTWRDLILKTPQFWLDMVSLENIMGERHGSTPVDVRFATAFLDLSAPCKIDITARFSAELRPPLLAPYLPRVTDLSLHLKPKYALELLQTLKSASMPHLTSVNIWHHTVFSKYQVTRKDWRALKAISLPPDAFPSFNALSIPSAFLIPGISLPSLRTAELANCDCMQCVMDESFLVAADLSSFLKRCPQLDHLIIARSLGPSFPVDSTPPPPPANLQCLRTLQLGYGDSLACDEISQILDHFSVPSGATAVFRCDNKDTLYIPPSVRKLGAISVVDHLSIGMDSPALCTVLCWADGDLRIDLETTVEFDGSPVRGVLEQIMDAFATPSVTHLELTAPTASLSHEYCVGESMSPLLSRFPSITRLQVRLGINPSDVFKALATHTSGGRPVCPNLEHLSVYWCLGKKFKESDFDITCKLIRKTLTRRAELGSPLATFVFKCEAPRMREVDDLSVMVEGVEQRLLAQFSSVANAVEVEFCRDAMIPPGSPPRLALSSIF